MSLFKESDAMSEDYLIVFLKQSVSSISLLWTNFDEVTTHNNNASLCIEYKGFIIIQTYFRVGGGVV